MDIFLVLANRMETVQMESTKMYTESSPNIIMNWGLEMVAKRNESKDDPKNTWETIEISPVDELGGECGAIAVGIKSQGHPSLRPAAPDGKQDNLDRSATAPSQH